MRSCQDEEQNMSDRSITCSLIADGTGANHFYTAHHVHKPVTTYTSKALATSDSHMVHV